jgi:nitrogen fixation/metabolism regulation signal transduction histidine kinase
VASPPGLRQAFQDLSLKAKVTLTLTAVFASIVAAFLVVLVPFLREQRAGLLEKDKRLLATLRDSYERGIIYDLISENQESLGVRLADLASQPGVLWARVESEGVELAATADRQTLRELLDEEARPFADEPARVLLVRKDGRADLVTTGGGSLLSLSQLPPAGLPAWKQSPGAPLFDEVRLVGRPVLYFTAPLAAANQRFGSLHVLYSLADVERGQDLTRRLFYALVGTSFLLLLVLLNVQLAAIVLAPVRNVQRAMSRAATGDLDVRLDVHSRDELASMAESFNRMVAELAASKRAVEDYSRNLETMVDARTRALQDSEARLLDLKNRLATVIANVGTGVVSLDAEGRIATFNDRAVEILGTPRELVGTLEGRRLEEVLHGETRRIVDLVEAVRLRQQPRAEDRFACVLPHGRRTLSVVATALPGEGALAGTVVVCDDLTQILATQRLEAWKEAVERVIHEIKNPLTPVGLAADTLKTAHAQDRARFEQLFPSAIDMVLSSVRSLKVLIGEFSRFSRLPQITLERCEPNDLVRTALALYAQSAGPNGSVVRLDLAEELPPVQADPEQLKRVLLNVVNNALEAMEARPGEVRVTTSASGPEVVMAVADHGPGVEDPERIFEPYYTTKVKGTGLGLAIARQIIEEHRGRITVESRLGEGTTLRIHLPAASRREERP